jgi:hypothetical protein
LSCPSSSSSSSIHHFLFTSPAWCAPPCCCCSFCAATDPVCCPVWWRQQKEPADCFMTYIYLCGSITSSSPIRPFSLSLSPAPIDPSLTPHSLFYRDEIDIHTHTWIRRDMRGHNEIWQSKREEEAEIVRPSPNSIG